LISRANATPQVEKWTGPLLALFYHIPFPRCEEEVGFQSVLAGVEVEVASAQCVERFVGAAFDDVSAFDDENLIGAAVGEDGTTTG
jgi:hypothetical protein